MDARTLDRLASRTRPRDAVLRDHVMEGVLRRLDRAPARDAFALRGSFLLRRWVAPAPRPADDLDFLGLGPFDPLATVAQLAAACSEPKVDDGVRFDTARLESEVIWADTRWPGVRVVLPVEVGDARLRQQIDVGFGDPLAWPAARQTLPAVQATPPARALCVCPEVGFGWKLHGLFELESGRWRSKDLHDLYLLIQHTPLDAARLPKAIQTAFASRLTALAVTARLVRRELGASRGSRRHWDDFITSRPPGSVPPLAVAVEAVAAFCAPHLAALGVG